MHCVSVGETRAAVPLIKALQAKYPSYQILITHATPTGRETSTALFGDTVLRAYLPYDLPFAVKRFLRHFRPHMVVLMETELWFNLIKQCHHADIPALLVNARLSEKSAKGYAKIATLTANALQQLSAIAAQTDDDAKRFMHFGVKPVISGNLKFDITVPESALTKGASFKAAFNDRPVFVAASTRDGEEALILQAINQLALPALLTIIVPRHPQRFDAVANLINIQQFKFQKRSDLNSALASSKTIEADTQVLLGDSMGELLSYYQASDVAFVGGSLLPFGGQNLIEPCAVGTPVLIGPHTFNFDLVTEEAIAAGAAKRIQDVDALASNLSTLIADKAARETMQSACLNFVAQKTGATEKTMQVISHHLN